MVSCIVGTCRLRLRNTCVQIYPLGFSLRDSHFHLDDNIQISSLVEDTKDAAYFEQVYRNKETVEEFCKLMVLFVSM